MAQLFAPANDWGAGAGIVRGNEIPNHDFLFFIYMQNFSDLLSVHLNEPCNKLDFSLIQIQGL